MKAKNGEYKALIPSIQVIQSMPARLLLLLLN
jgi:hypothetical protein